MQYEDKLRKALTYLGDKIEWPLFYDQLARVVNMWNELKEGDEDLRAIVNRWVRRRKKVTFFYFPPPFDRETLVPEISLTM